MVLFCFYAFKTIGNSGTPMTSKNIFYKGFTGIYYAFSSKKITSFLNYLFSFHQVALIAFGLHNPENGQEVRAPLIVGKLVKRMTF
jgi:hypothetical protein